MNKNPPSTLAVERKHLRPLRCNEHVRHGDFVAEGPRNFALWEGPGGFRADTFVKQIYRWQER
jgi:hypothetical protein